MQQVAWVFATDVNIAEGIVLVGLLLGGKLIAWVRGNAITRNGNNHATDLVLWVDLMSNLSCQSTCYSIMVNSLVAVLHDSNFAFRYTFHLIIIEDGEVTAAGDPTEIVTAGLIEEVYNVKACASQTP